MSSIVLVNPPLSERARGGNLAAALARSIPYGLLSLASVLRKAGREVQLVDAMNFAMSTEEAATRILAHDPAYVGVTTATISMGNTAALARELKKRRPELRVLIGGAHISSVPEETMERFPEIDLGVLGEAENTVLELLPALDAKGSLDGVKGIIFRADGKLVRTGRRPLIEDLDVLPMPAWDLLSNMELYRPSTPSYLRLPSTTIITSRGCAAKCTFCNSRAIFGVKMRSFSADYLLEMVERLQRTYGIRDLSIYDDNFVAFEDRLEKICKTIIDRKLDLTWSCYSRVDQGNEALFRMMKRAGCWQVSYGIESGSQRVLDHIRKGTTLAQIDDTLRKTQRAGLRTRGFFMIGHLTDDVASIRETIRFMRRAPLDDFHFTYFTPLPGTPANVVAEKYGAFDKTWDNMNMQNPVFIPKGLTARELEFWSRIAYLRFYARPKVVASYMGMLKYPGAVTKLRSGATALLSRIFLS